MAKRPPSTQKARITRAWLRTRPDHKYSASYDQFYIDLAEELMDDIFGISLEFSEEYDEDQHIKLAVAIAGYFEDFISEVGLWKAFRDRCREELQRDLPFYDLDGYDPDYVNWQDIALLIWVWIARDFEGPVPRPHDPSIIGYAEDWAEILEEKIDDAPATSYFDEFLEVKDVDKFFDVRLILNWLTLDSWLFGLLDKGYTYELDLMEVLEEGRDHSIEHVKIFEHDLAQNLSFNGVTRFGGMHMNEMGARIIRGNQKLKDRLEGLGRRLGAEFELLEEAKDHYVLQHVKSRRNFEVTKESVQLKTSFGKYGYTYLARWGDTYWVNGAYLPSHTLQEPRPVQPVLSYQFANANEREQMVNTAAEQEAVFKDVFGDSLVISKGYQAVQDATTRYYRALELYNAKKAGREAKLDNLPKLPFPPTNKEQIVAIYFAPGEGVHFNPVAAKVIDYLQNGSEHDFSSPLEMLITLVKNCDLSLVKYIYANYGLEEALRKTNAFEDVANVTAMCWFFNPNGCTKPVPSLSLINHEGE